MIDRLSVAFIHGRKEKGKGRVYGRIELRLTMQRKQKYISTGIRCGWNDWECSHPVCCCWKCR